MGKSSSQKKPNKGQFQGIGAVKAPRRQNNPNGTPRKLHVQLRKEQAGSPIAAFARANNAALEKWANDRVANGEVTGPFSANSDAYPAGKLRDLWHDAGKASSGTAAARKYMKATGASASEAKKALVGNPWITFGADPLSR